MKKKIISIVTPCFNEADNITQLYNRIRLVMKRVSKKYEYEQIIIDNCSTDDTVKIAKRLARLDKRLKIIVNNRNYGPVRSPYYGTLCARGDAVVLIAADLQEPPELIPDFIKKWEEGYDVVLAKKPISQEIFYMKIIRRSYYKIINNISETPLEADSTGAGLFDKKVIETLKLISDPYPYFRGLVCELGFPRATIEFVQPPRMNGASKATWYGMLDQALLAMTKHSRLPLRFMTVLGLLMGTLTLLISIVFFILKLLFWNEFPIGISPILIGFFFISSIQFFFLGLIGEYVGTILTHQRNMPLVIEKERVNFDK